MVFLNTLDNYLSILFSQHSLYCSDFTQIGNQGFSCLFCSGSERELII